MENKHQVHNLILLDESGSMNAIKDLTIQGFNEMVQTIHGVEQQFPEQAHFITFITFNSLENKLLHFMEPASNLQQINSTSYQPNASTPLFDAMGFGILKLKEALANQTDYNVLVTILTDGEENASREFNGKSISTLVEEMQKGNWTFTYIGTDHDVERIAFSLSIENTMTFQKNSAGIKKMFVQERDARVNYSRKMACKENLTKNYFDLKDIDPI